MKRSVHRLISINVINFSIRDRSFHIVVMKSLKVENNKLIKKILVVLGICLSVLFYSLENVPDF